MATNTIDSGVLAWVQANFPGATNIHTNDAQNFLGGVKGSGVVFTTPATPGVSGPETHLMPNNIPQYGIGGRTGQDAQGNPVLPTDPNAISPQQQQDNYYAAHPDVPRTGVTVHGGSGPTAMGSDGFPVAAGAPNGATPFGTTSTGGALGGPTPSQLSHLTTAQTDAFGTVKAELDQYGLASMAQFVYTEIVAGRSSEEVLRDLRNSPEYNQRFPAIKQRLAAGLPALSPGDYVNYERQATELMRAAGLPKGFYDSPSDFTSLLSNDVSPSELNDRIGVAKAATYNIAPEDAARLSQHYGITPGSGALTAYFLDPNRALPLLQNQFQAAKIGGAADRAGFAGVSNDTALGLARQGVSDAQASQGFNYLQHNQEVLSNLPGQADTNFTQKQELDATFGNNAQDQDAIEAQRRRRGAQFQDGGQFVASQTGTAGLGRADQK